MYEVIKYFTDLEDDNFAYHVGDTYPREGKEVTMERINALLSGNNKRNAKFIVEQIPSVSEAKEEAQKETKEAPKKKASSTKSKSKTKEG